ncbi:hypothetical protein D3C75_846870 [compost metagenome]
MSLLTVTFFYGDIQFPAGGDGRQIINGKGAGSDIDLCKRITLFFHCHGGIAFSNAVDNGRETILTFGDHAGIRN